MSQHSCQMVNQSWSLKNNWIKKTVSIEGINLSLYRQTRELNSIISQSWYFNCIMFISRPLEKLEYQAQSPDEAALVMAARNFGFVFKVILST